MPITQTEIDHVATTMTMERQNKRDFRGATPESWDCVDCGMNTAPGCSNRVQMEQAFADPNNQSVTQTIDDQSELYMVKAKVWKAARMEDMGGCLCIGCLENRIGQTLVPKDFARNHVFHALPCTARLLSRLGNRHSLPF